jgi:TPR repeat protein
MRVLIICVFAVSLAVRAFGADLEAAHRAAVAKLTNADAGDDAEGFAALAKVAGAGLAAAQYDLAVCYERGTGTARDYAAEVTWLERAAKQGYVDAAYKLAHAYRVGRGVAEDHGRAFTWYLTAAQAGDVAAQNNVATAYRDGDGVARSSAKAIEWYVRAGEGGDPEALANLTRLYVDAHDWPAAEQWLLAVWPARDRYTLAAQAQMDDLRRQVERSLTAPQKNEAELRAQAWLRAHPWR